MRYCFILGRCPELSIAEIYSVLTSYRIAFSLISASREVLIVDCTPIQDVSNLLNRLGGTIKIGELLFDEPLKESALDIRVKEVVARRAEVVEGRLTFGLSTYTLAQNDKKNHIASLSRRIHALGLTLKKELRSEGFSVRLVVSQQKLPALSSVVVQKNNLVGEQGLELLLLQSTTGVYLGQTKGVQAFEEYAYRDFGRPVRTMQVGLLPPKLAQILINLTGIPPKGNPKILDPFCGFGTVLQELLLLGFSNIAGSDIAHTMVHASQQNLAWFNTQRLLPRSIKPESMIHVRDVTILSHYLPKHSFDAVITEPYLGPTIRRSSSVKDIERAITLLTPLYLAAFQEFSKILKPGGIVSMVWPVWNFHNKLYFLPLIDRIVTMGFTLATQIPEPVAKWPHVTARRTMLYAREDQHVAREFLIFQKS